MNKQLAKKYYTQSYSRYSRLDHPVDPERFMQLVVDDCIELIQASKHPGKLAIVKLLKEHYGYESIQV